MRFKDREEAAKRLAEKLKKYRGAKDAVVIALPRGGVVLGRVIADALALPLDLVVPRKIGAPGNEEYAIGAITEVGKPVWNEVEAARVSESEKSAAMGREQAEAKRRLSAYRPGMGPRDVLGKTVIVVDDGIATGYTMRAAIESLKAEQPGAIVLAVPVAARDSAASICKTVDACVILDRPELFLAVGEFYDDFPQADDEEVIRLMKR
jgi:predicted phosphoribosyltransferase